MKSRRSGFEKWWESGLGLGFGLGPAATLRGEGKRGWGFVGSVLGTGVAAAFALAPRVPLGAGERVSHKHGIAREYTHVAR